MLVCDVKSCKTKIDTQHEKFRLKNKYYLFCNKCSKEFNDLISNELSDGDDIIVGKTINIPTYEAKILYEVPVYTNNTTSATWPATVNWSSSEFDTTMKTQSAVSKPLELLEISKKGIKVKDE